METSVADVYLDGLGCLAMAFLRGRQYCKRRRSFCLESLGRLLLAGPHLSSWLLDWAGTLALGPSFQHSHSALYKCHSFQVL